MRLTADEIDKIPDYRDKWKAIAFDTKRASRPKAEKIIARVYEAAGLAPPSEIIWFQSPLAAKKFYVDQTGDTNPTLQYIYGAQDANWLSSYSFALEECGAKEIELLVPLMELAEQVGWCIPFAATFLVSEKPTEIHLKDNGLHCESGPAMAYADGYAIWCLNGVRVSQEIVETPWDKLDARLVITEKNAEVRREIVRKVGIERICKELNARTVDKTSYYELLELDIGRGEPRRPYLKMLNPSIDIYHIEGVPPGTKTVEEALAWRCGGELPDTVDGVSITKLLRRD